MQSENLPADICRNITENKYLPYLIKIYTEIQNIL